MEKYRRICAFIDLDAVEYNFEQMRQALTPGIQMIAVVKADAYGHGAVPIAALMEPKEYIWGFAVATTEEALRLRRHGIRKPILILGYVFPEDYPLLAEYEIRPAVFTLQMAEELSQAAQDAGKILPVHLAVDTGMTRIGFRNARESLADMVHISKMPGLFVEGIFTHFARADEQDVQWARKQYEEFSEYLRLLEQEGIRIPVRHCNNSAGILWHREGDLDAVRPGITIYGVYPSGEVIRNGVSLKPVMRLVSHISHIKEVEAGVPVSYGGTWGDDPRKNQNCHYTRRLRGRRFPGTFQPGKRADRREEGAGSGKNLYGPVHGGCDRYPGGPPSRSGYAAGQGW